MWRSVRVQKTQLATPPRFVWKKLVATPSCNGRVHVTSVHHVSARLLDGSNMHQKVVALIEIDEVSGTIIQCDELTRMGAHAAAEVALPFETGFMPPTAVRETGFMPPPAAMASNGRRGGADRPRTSDPPSKHARSEPSSLAEQVASCAGESGVGSPRACGIALQRSGVSDLLGDMCSSFYEEGRGEARKAAELYDSSAETEVDTEGGRELA